MNNNGFVPLENLLASDVLNSALVSEIGSEDISLNIAPSTGAFTDPFTQELEPIKPIELLEDNQSLNYNSSQLTSNNFASDRAIDNLTGAAINNNALNSDSFTGFKTDK